MTNPGPSQQGDNVIRFFLDDELVELAGVDPTRTVLQYLREDRRRTGTKEGCAEGDCGACTVVIGEATRSGRLKLKAMNSCIQFLPVLDGKQLFTVESLGSAKDLHPVQQALVDCHGSQCGFCTPGFVMTLFAVFKNRARHGRRDIDDELAGNLCRCTGYRPIIEAAGRMYDYAEQPGNGEWLRQAATDERDADNEEQRLAARLAKLQRTECLHIQAGDRHFYAPRNCDQLAAVLKQEPGALLLAGGTDIGLWVNKQFQRPAILVYTGQVEELREIRRSDEYLEIGSAVTVTDAMPSLLDEYPELDELLRRFASPPIRNAATLGGNIANGSPIGDSMPALIALGARVVLQSGDAQREIPLEDLYVDYQVKSLAAGEFVRSVRIPRRRDDQRFATYKVSKRFDQDISAVCGAFMVRIDGSTVTEARVAYGGMAAIPRRAAACEAALREHGWTGDGVRAASNKLDEDFDPISDMRAGAGYRRLVCRNLLLRFFAASNGPSQGVYDYGR
jgi:xanthine dehydrogenase small subunit